MSMLDPSRGTPRLITPSPRVMRREGATADRLRTGAMRPINAGEASLDWAPRALSLYTHPYPTEPGAPVRAGSAVAIVRDGYEGAPLGIATEDYRPVAHQATHAEILRSTEATCTYDGAIIDGHGYHVIHAYRVTTTVTEIVGDLPLISRLSVVHDHTGAGSLRASVVCYLGREVVVGSANYTRRIHVGAGALDVGVGSGARWAGTTIPPMLESAALQQGAIAQILRAARGLTMTEPLAEIFEARGVAIERTRPTADERARGVAPAIVPVTALDALIAHHRVRRGRPTWGVWSRRLEGGALSALAEITGITIPRQLYRRG